MTRHALLFGMGLAVSALGFGTPAQAAGTLVQGDGSFVGGPTEAVDIAHVRAVLFQQQDAVTAVIQAATRADETIGSAWILPIHGEILAPPAAADPAMIAELLRVSDPMFEQTVAGIPGCTVGCSAMGDSGQDVLADLGVFEATKAGATWSHFGPSVVGAAMDSLVDSGFALTDALQAGLEAHAASGGSVVVMFFTDERLDAATPALVVRYEASEMLMPQALTALSADATVQTSVLTITADGATGPVGVPHVMPELGIPLYEPTRTPEFYTARARLALDEAGGSSWLLEYSNTLESLDERSDRLLELGVLWEAGGRPWSGLRALVDRGLLDSFRAEEVWITRWRTYQKPEYLTDQVFAPDASVPAYEVYLEASQFSAAAWAWPMPLLLGAWAFGRRRRRV